MTEIGIALPGESIQDVENAARATAAFPFDSFSVYGDLGDLPPYAVLHASAAILRDSPVRNVGPMGVPVGLQHPEVIATHALALAEQLPGRTSIGLVRGAFMDTINQKPATLQALNEAVTYIMSRCATLPEAPPVYLGGFGPKLLSMAGELAVDGVKLGGSANPALAHHASKMINNTETSIVLGAVSVIDEDRVAARALARRHVAKYLAVVGALDPTLNEDDRDSLSAFMHAYHESPRDAHARISDSLLDMFAMAGTPDDALRRLNEMDGIVDRFEFGTPHGLGRRADAITLIGQSILQQRQQV